MDEIIFRIKLINRICFCIQKKIDLLLERGDPNIGHYHKLLTKMQFLYAKGVISSHEERETISRLKRIFRDAMMALP